MISLNEDVLTLTAATREVPRRRRGRKAAVSTLYRWARHGLRGVHLEVIQIGGTLCTSRQALERFFYRLTEVAADQGMSANPPKDDDSIEQSLDELGV